MTAVHAEVAVPVAEPGGFVTVPEAAVIARCHIETVREALRSGELHGTQRVKGGTWKLRPECVSAWVEGVSCAHQVERHAPVAMSSYRARRGAL